LKAQTARGRPRGARRAVDEHRPRGLSATEEDTSDVGRTVHFGDEARRALRCVRGRGLHGGGIDAQARNVS
jgi:hypothetical protein